jgi:hypothetical protein
MTSNPKRDKITGTFPKRGIQTLQSEQFGIIPVRVGAFPVRNRVREYRRIDLGLPNLSNRQEGRSRQA